MYEGVYVKMIYTNKFNENLDISTTYLGQTKMTRDTKITAEEKFPITGQGFALGKIIGWHRMSNFVGHGCYKILHVKVLLFVMQSSTCITKISSNIQRIQVGNGQYVSVLFVIPVIIDIHRQRFEIFTLVSEIHDNVDLVMGMENIFELECVIDS